MAKLGLLEVPDTYDTFRSSQLQTYQVCPRQYLYEHLLRWEEDRADRSALHLSFGSAHHVAQETLLLMGYTPEAVAQAYINFENEWLRSGYGVTDLLTVDKDFSKIIINVCKSIDSGAVDINHTLDTLVPVMFDFPKKPEAKSTHSELAALLRQYAARPFNIKDSKVLYTEIGFVVPIAMKYILRGRIDAILETPRGIVVIDHKTTGRAMSSYIDQWNVKFQAGAYTHFACAEFGIENVNSFRIWATIFKKGATIEFTEIPVYRNKELLETWHWEAQCLIADLVRDFDRLSHVKEDDIVMKAFPRCGEACSNYYGCPFIAFCSTLANPTRVMDAPPIGFRLRKAEEDEFRPVKKEMSANG